MTASPTRSNAAAMRQNKLVGATGMGPGGLFVGPGGSRTPMPVSCEEVCRRGRRRPAALVLAPRV
jgi:hypothetical protein